MEIERIYSPRSSGIPPKNPIESYETTDCFYIGPGANDFNRVIRGNIDDPYLSSIRWKLKEIVGAILIGMGVIWWLVGGLCL